ncbi:hypothetical protein G6F57_022413 [Rhizopus arrhizus]|nr:hypothetical protein G6F57_022413 [Rhizopus arrhizus]
MQGAGYESTRSGGAAGRHPDWRARCACGQPALRAAATRGVAWRSRRHAHRPRGAATALAAARRHGRFRCPAIRRLPAPDRVDARRGPRAAARSGVAARRRLAKRRRRAGLVRRRAPGGPR